MNVCVPGDIYNNLVWQMFNYFSNGIVTEGAGSDGWVIHRNFSGLRSRFKRPNHFTPVIRYPSKSSHPLFLLSPNHMLGTSHRICW